MYNVYHILLLYFFSIIAYNTLHVIYSGTFKTWSVRMALSSNDWMHICPCPVWTCSSRNRLNWKPTWGVSNPKRSSASSEDLWSFSYIPGGLKTQQWQIASFHFTFSTRQAIKRWETSTPICQAALERGGRAGVSLVTPHLMLRWIWKTVRTVSLSGIGD